VQEWQRGDFHVRYVVLFKDSQRFMLVYPISGNLKDILDKKGAGTIYRFCFTTPDLNAAFKELTDAGVQPENEHGEVLKIEDLAAPSGVPTIWLPKVIGDLSIEILEEAPQEARLSARRAENT
jgi:methylmalonyl-CoA/ethylmalonyl-CoA epimerase